MVATETFEVMTSSQSRRILDSVASLLAATLYQGNPDCNHKLWNIVSSERDIRLLDVFFKTVGIPMGTNCAPLLADLFFHSYETDFIHGIFK
jgi:hypothetical protein